jgi:hypothetical protein
LGLATAFRPHGDQLVGDVGEGRSTEKVSEHLDQPLMLIVDGLRETIIDPQTFPPIFHETRVSEIAEVPRRLGLRHVEKALDLAAAKHLVSEEEEENVEPRLLGKRFEPSSQSPHDVSPSSLIPVYAGTR